MSVASSAVSVVRRVGNSTGPEGLKGLRFREQIGERHSKCVGNSRDIPKRGVTQPQFYAAEVGPVYAGLLRQFLLGQMLCLT